jgi:DNA-binding MarR family transcriptional regulator
MTSPPSTSGTDGLLDVRRLGDVVTQLRRGLRRRMRSASPDSTLPMAQLEVLQSLAELEPVRMGELAEKLHLAMNTVSTLSAALVRDGWVARERAADDRRGVLLTLTPAGNAYLERWQRDLDDVLAEAVAELDDPAQDALRQALPALQHVVARLATDSN